MACCFAYAGCTNKNVPAAGATKLLTVNVVAVFQDKRSHPRRVVEVVVVVVVVVVEVSAFITARVNGSNRARMSFSTVDNDAAAAAAAAAGDGAVDKGGGHSEYPPAKMDGDGDGDGRSPRRPQQSQKNIILPPPQSPMANIIAKSESRWYPRPIPILMRMRGRTKQCRTIISFY